MLLETHCWAVGNSQPQNGQAFVRQCKNKTVHKCVSPLTKARGGCFPEQGEKALELASAAS